MSDEYTPLQDPEALPKAFRVTKLEPQPGEVLHASVGLENMGDGLPPWLPSEEDLEYVRQQFEEVLPDVPMLVTYMGIVLSSHEAPSQIEIEEVSDGGSD